MLSKKLKGTHSQFQGADFTATKWNTAEDKAWMGNKLTRFILNGFPRGSFTKGMYKRLSTMFGHIAEYNLDGFYSVWFETDAACLRWTENVTRGGLLGLVVGDPAWTWSDVEKAIQRWMTENHIVEQIRTIHTIESHCLPLEASNDRQLVLFEANKIGEAHD